MTTQEINLIFKVIEVEIEDLKRNRNRKDVCSKCIFDEEYSRADQIRCIAWKLYKMETLKTHHIMYVIDYYEEVVSLALNSDVLSNEKAIKCAEIIARMRERAGV